MDEDKLGHVYTLLSEHWKLPEPELVISITSGKFDPWKKADMYPFLANLMETTKNSSISLVKHVLLLVQVKTE